MHASWCYSPRARRDCLWTVMRKEVNNRKARRCRVHWRPYCLPHSLTLVGEFQRISSLIILPPLAKLRMDHRLQLD